jgi:hypothetical protein
VDTAKVARLEATIDDLKLSMNKETDAVRQQAQDAQVVVS